MSGLQSIGISLPRQSYTRSDVSQVGSKWLAGHPEYSQLFDRFLESSKTDRRFFCLSPEELLKEKGMKERSSLFEERGLTLALASARQSLDAENIASHEIDVLISTSCSAPIIPPLDSLLIEGLELRRDILRIPVYQYGCAGGIIGLNLAEKLSREGRKVLLSCTELCSLGFFPSDFSAGHLVGAAIFADGSASAIVHQDARSLRFIASHSCMTSASRHLMGYDLLDDGAHLRLDKELPSFLAREVPRQVEAFLKTRGIPQGEIAWWLFHPGGAKILSILQELLKLENDQCSFASNILTNYGNLSSASVLLVIDNFLKSQKALPGEKVLLLGMGPGLSIELILFEVG